jgi:Tfp pilus assembly protein PilO
MNKDKTSKRRIQAPKWLPIALVGVAGVIALFGGWVVLLGPKQHQISNLHSQAASVREQVAADLSRASTARGATGAPTIKVADIYKLQTAMPSTTDMPDLLLELDQTAEAAGVQLESIQPSSAAASSAGNYTTVPITMTASGNFYAVTDLLYRLRNLVYVRAGALEANGRIFSVNSVTLSPNGKLVTASISLNTYVYGAAPSSSTTPTPGGATSTTTTDTTTTPSSSGPAAAGAGTP